MKRLIKSFSLLTMLSLIVFISCQKQVDKPSQQQSEEVGAANKEHGHLQQAKTFSSDVVIKWLNLDQDLLRLPLPTGTTVQGGERILAYSGIALYEAVVNGMPAYQSLSGQLTDFPTMPSTDPGKAYHWAAAANAALAQETRYLFDTASSSTNLTIKQQRLDKINALEKSLEDAYATEVDAATLQRSISFGKDVASRVSFWADNDGYKLQGGAYTPPPPTPLQALALGTYSSAPATPINPYVSLRRLLVHGSDNGATIDPFPSFSTTAGSEFYEMANDVYTKSLVTICRTKKPGSVFSRCD
jgi:hypothetical protein